MTVCSLIHLNDPELYRVQTLTLETIRTGFPSCNVEIYLNSSLFQVDAIGDIVKRCEANKLGFAPMSTPIHHAEWIHHMLKKHRYEETLVIVDPDVIFWKEWDFARYKEENLQP